METPNPVRPARIKRWLPYWAVFQADLRQTLHGWVYRVWVLSSVLGAVGYLLYRYGVDREAGIVQPASTFISDLLRWSVLGSVALIIALAGGSISSERGIMADSVLSRGISRYQYFLGKWHARLVAVTGTFLAMGLAALAGSFFLLHEDMHPVGCLVALATVMALLAAVTTCGVTVSAVANSTVLGIAVLWMVLYGVGFALSLLPVRYPTPDYVLTNLPNILRGYYDLQILGRLMLGSAVGSLAVALFGLAYFSRRDV
jgi:ABC-2 type transport system permease protein